MADYSQIVVHLLIPTKFILYIHTHPVLFNASGGAFQGATTFPRTVVIMVYNSFALVEIIK